MKNRSIIKRTRHVMTAVLTAAACMLCPLSASAGTPYTGGSNEYYRWDECQALEDENFTGAVFKVNQTFSFTADGEQKVSLFECRIKSSLVDMIWFGRPYVQNCSSCTYKAASPDLCSCRVFIEDAAGNELASRQGNMLLEHSETG